MTLSDDELAQRFVDAVGAWMAKRERTRLLREQLAAARTAGKNARYARRLAGVAGVAPGEPRPEGTAQRCGPHEGRGDALVPRSPASGETLWSGQDPGDEN